MEEAVVTAATGALGPVIAKLAALLGSEYKLQRRTRTDVKFIRSKLKPVHSLLWNIWEREVLDAPSMALKMEALDLADELDDTIFDFTLSLELSCNNKLFVQTKSNGRPFQDFKKQASDVSGRCCGKWKDEKKKPFSRLLPCGKIATDDSSSCKPRPYLFVHKDASELVGMAEQRDMLIHHLVGEDEATPLVQPNRKVAFIHGSAGMGKTTLADLVYQAIGHKFQSRAFVSIAPGGNMREVLARILEQVAPNSSVPLANTKEEHLINIISNFLMEKRYLVIVDDIWNLRELEMIMKSLPENNLGSRIVGISRIKVAAEKWHTYGPNAVHEMNPEWDSVKGWVYKIGEENVATGMLSMKADLVSGCFDCEHPIVEMCGGTPLAVRCMLSAVTEEREKQARQGLHVKISDVQDDILKHAMENGIQNTPGFEALVESLQLGYVTLPHHMLKTCLLYCNIYPEKHSFEKDDLVRRWICEGFVYTEEEANCYIEELVDRGLFLRVSFKLRMHPMMRNFLQCRSRQDNFTTCTSEITPSCWIRRLCIDDSSCRSRDEVDPLSTLDWNHIRSLVVHEGIERVPLKKLENVRMLDLSWATDLPDNHLKHICGLVGLRHLLGINGLGISDIPPDIVSLQRLETFEASDTPLPGFIGNLKQLKTLIGRQTAELPREIGALQKLKTLKITGKHIKELPREIGSLHELETLTISGTNLVELPKEIGNLQQLKTLDMYDSWIDVLPKEIGSLQQLKSLDISFSAIKVLPKEIGKLQHLQHLLLADTPVSKIPREIGRLKELKCLKMDDDVPIIPLEVYLASDVFELPEFIRQALKKSDILSELAGEMLSFRTSGGIIVGAKHMLIPSWIKKHFNNAVSLDIRICKLDEQGLKILREMPNLENLCLRFEVVPKEPVVITSEGFSKLDGFRVDSRVPRVTFEEGAMPMLRLLSFDFRIYAGPPNKDPVGIKHLTRLVSIVFDCEDWYSGAYMPCIGPTIDIIRKEAYELPNNIRVYVTCGEEVLSSPRKINSYITGARKFGEIEEENWLTSPPPPFLQREMRQSETDEQGSSSGLGEIEENIQD